MHVKTVLEYEIDIRHKQVIKNGFNDFCDNSSIS